MLAESVITVRDALKKEKRPFRLFFDNNQVINSLTDVLTWNDDLKVLHVIRTTQDVTFQEHTPVEVLTFGYEDIRSISFYHSVDEITESMVALQGIGGTEFSATRAAKITAHFEKVLTEQNKSMY